MGLSNYIVSGADAMSFGKVVKTGGKDDPVVAKAMASFDKLKAAYQGTGLPAKIIDLALIQDWMESGAFTNKGYLQYNNPGSLMWPAHGLKYGKKGGLCTSNGTCFAAFKDLNEYALQKALEIRKGPGYPVQATSSADYVHRLGMNGYYGKEPESSYFNKMKAAAARINLLASLHEDIHQDIQVPDKKINPLIWVAVGIAGIMALSAIFNAARD